MTMKDSLLRTVAAAAMSSVDKKSATQMASTVIAGVGNRQANPAVRALAGLVASALNASAQNDLGGGTPGSNAPGSSTGGWQRAQESLSAAKSKRPEPAPGSQPVGATAPVSRE